MPTLESARVSTDGSGTLKFAADADPATLILASQSDSATLTIPVSGENIGNGIGLFAGLTTQPPITSLLEFKSLAAGPGIIIEDRGDSVLFSSQSVTQFVGLVDGPRKITGNAVLFGNAISGKLDWSAAPTRINSMLTWLGSSFEWTLMEDIIPSLAATGDDAIVVSTATTANGQSLSISLGNTAVVAGNYGSPDFSVDSHGRITAIANAAQPIRSFRIMPFDSSINVTGSPITTNNATVTLALSNTTVVAGSYGFASLIVDRQGRITAITSNLAPLNQIIGNGAISASATDANGAVTLMLRPSGVSPGTYAYATVTVDDTGRLTNVAAGQMVGRIDVTTDANLTVSGSPLTANGTLALGMAPTTVAAGRYSFVTVTLDAYGRVQNAVSGNPSASTVLAGLRANTSVVSLYAGVSNGIQYLSALAPTTNVTLSLSNTATFAGQTANSGVIAIDLSNTGVAAGTYNQVSVDAKGRVSNGAMIVINGASLTGDVIGNGAGGSGTIVGGTYFPPVINTVLASLFAGPATFTQVVIDTKGRVTAGSFSNSVAATTLRVTGDVSGSGPLSNTINLTLNSIGSAGTYAQVVVDSTGRVTSGLAPSGIAVGFVNLTGDISAVGNSTALNPVVTTLAASGVLAGTYAQVVVNTKGLVTTGISSGIPISLQNDVVGTSNAAGIIAATLANSGVAAGTYNQVTVDSKGRVIVGTNISTAANTTLTVAGDVSGSGLLSSTISLTLANSGVIAGTYNRITVDSKGRVTVGNNVSTVANTTLTIAGDVSGSGLLSNTISLTLANSGVTAGNYNQVTVDSKGRVTVGTNVSAISNTTLILAGDVSGSGLLSNTISLALANSGVVAGTYNQVTVDSKGRVTVGTNASTVGNTTLTVAGDVSGSGLLSNTISLTLANSGVTAGVYNQVTVDNKGRVTLGATVSTAASTTLTLTGDVTGSGLLSNAIALTLTNSGVVAGTYNQVTVDAKGRVTVGAVQTYLSSASAIALSQLPVQVIDTPITFSFSGYPGASQQANIPLLINLNLSANLSGSAFYAGVLPAVTATFTLAYWRSGSTTTLGTISINTSGTFTASTSAVTLNQSDVLLLTAPAVQDATLQNVGITILTTKR